jgi:predicted 3-demethylubiquinone-9 3-methyltransferase (glyoxalase superfamily)
VLSQLIYDQEKAPKAMKAFMTMKKFNIEALINATL